MILYTIMLLFCTTRMHCVSNIVVYPSCSRSTAMHVAKKYSGGQSRVRLIHVDGERLIWKQPLFYQDFLAEMQALASFKDNPNIIQLKCVDYKRGVFMMEYFPDGDLTALQHDSKARQKL